MQMYHLIEPGEKIGCVLCINDKYCLVQSEVTFIRVGKQRVTVHSLILPTYDQCFIKINTEAIMMNKPIQLDKPFLLNDVTSPKAIDFIGVMNKGIYL